ncbi:MAG: sugar-binding transcriptional regulator [Actinobacteria bacterium]|nr:sugar-binding transcriptional regulator [Actinomycetota bacterium]
MVKDKVDLFEERLKLKVSRLFFEKRMNKIDIGKKLKVSRFKVARLLDDAINEGLVEIVIHKKPDNFQELEDSIEDRFNIKRVVVCESSEDPDELKRNLGASAAKLLMEIVEDGDCIGIAWGSTLNEVLNSIPRKTNLKDIICVQITGGLNQVPPEINALDLTRRISEKFNAKSYLIYAPTILDDMKSMEILVNQQGIKETIGMFSKVNIALVGVGTVLPKPSTYLYRGGFINEDDFKSIASSHAVGDINTSFYDSKGKTCSTSLDNRVIAMSHEQFKKVNYCIGVAGGKEKWEAIKAAITGSIINILITDEDTAKYLIKS